MATTKKEKFYKIKLVSPAPKLKTEHIPLEKIAEEQKKEFEESRADNKGKAAWLMPSGSIFWSSAGTEINNAKKIIFKEEKPSSKGKQKKGENKPKAKGKKRKK